MEAQLLSLEEAAEVKGGIAEYTSVAADMATVVGIGFAIYFGLKGGGGNKSSNSSGGGSGGGGGGGSS